MMKRLPLLQMSFLAVTAAFLLAATDISRPVEWNSVQLYLYWVGRLLIEASLIIAALQILIQIPLLRGTPGRLIAVAILVSLVPFVLSVTALDIVLGFPELDEVLQKPFGPDEMAPNQIGAFFRELVYLLDNHVALGLLIAAPLLFKGMEDTFAGAEESAFSRIGDREEGFTNQGTTGTLPESDRLADEPADRPPLPDIGTILFLSRLEPPFRGHLAHAEAQEHYVRLVGDLDSRMILYRFNDVLHELPEALGMQVHRSHWVAYDAVKRLFREGTNLRLETSDGTIVPVSRKYATDVQKAFRDLTGA
jgi:hypothetical protein